MHTALHIFTDLASWKHQISPRASFLSFVHFADWFAALYYVHVYRSYDISCFYHSLILLLSEASFCSSRWLLSCNLTEFPPPLCFRQDTIIKSVIASVSFSKTFDVFQAFSKALKTPHKTFRNLLFRAFILINFIAASVILTAIFWRHCAFHFTFICVFSTFL